MKVEKIYFFFCLKNDYVVKLFVSDSFFFYFFKSTLLVGSVSELKYKKHFVEILARFILLRGLYNKTETPQVPLASN